jgi:hypothetical protein
LKHATAVATAVLGVSLVLAMAHLSPRPEKPERQATCDAPVTPVTHDAQPAQPKDDPSIEHAIWYYEPETDPIYYNT